MLVGEAWGEEEYNAKQPFVGGSGRFLDAMLRDAGYPRESLFLTNLVANRPPGNAFWHFLEPSPRSPRYKKELLYHGVHASPELITEHGRLERQVAACQPKLIICAGNYATWAFSDEPRIKLKARDLEGNPLDGGSRLLPAGIQDLRGSMLRSRPIGAGQRRYPVLPVLHPAGVLRDYTGRHLFVHDLRHRIPFALNDIWDNPYPGLIHIEPSWEDAMRWLSALLSRLDGGIIEVSNDVETRRGLITCIGFGYEPNEAFVLPFLNKNAAGDLFSYWPVEQEVELRRLVRAIFKHSNFRAIGQNYNYDRAYIDEEFGVVPRCSFDTMLAQHLIFPGTEKGLGFLSSMYRDYHRYWKDDSKNWATSDKISASQHYHYNGEDILATMECAATLRIILAHQGLEKLYLERLRIMDWAYHTTAPGIRADLRRRNAFYVKLMEAAEVRHEYMKELFPDELVNSCLETHSQAKSFKPSRTPWYASPQKLAVVLYDILDLPKQYAKKSFALTTDSKAIETLLPMFPEHKLLFTLIEQMRSIRVYKSTFLEAIPEPSMRYRTFLDPTGTGTFRFSSYENPFGRGMNLQNVPGD